MVASKRDIDLLLSQMLLVMGTMLLLPYFRKIKLIPPYKSNCVCNVPELLAGVAAWTSAFKLKHG